MSQRAEGSAKQDVCRLVRQEAVIELQADKFSVRRPENALFLRGTMVGRDRIEYGIESYYVQEGTGADYEQAIRSHRLSAEVAISPDGPAALRSLRIDTRQ